MNHEAGIARLSLGRPLRRGVAGLLLASACTSAWGQRLPPVENITVVGERPIFGIPPERSFDETAIGDYGLGTIGELLDEVTAEAGETRDEPVFLVNGERVSSLGDIADFPTETVERIDLLPVGSAAKVGASATRRVVNVVLKRAVDTVAVRAALRAATEGDWTARRGDASYTRIRAARRLNISGRVRRESSLRESERDIVQPDGSPADLGDFRTLRPEVEDYELKLAAADQLTGWLHGSFNAEIGRSDSDSLLGLTPTTAFVRGQSRDRTDGLVSLSLNADVGSWLVNFLGDYQYQRAVTGTDQVHPGDPLAMARSRTTATVRTATADLVATGPLFALPPGTVRGTFGAGLGRDSIRSTRRLLGTDTTDNYVQRSRSAHAAIEIPLASRAEGFLAGLGELVANAEIRQTHVSDFGSFTNQTYSLQWQPVAQLRLFASVTTGKTPPSAELTSEPLIETPGVRYYDPLRDETVDVIEISGGNPALGAQRDETRRLSVNLKPLPKVALQLFGDYFAIRNRDIITPLPPASQLILEAFPERFVRDVDGRLVSVDVRPVSLAEQSEDRIRYGFNLNLPLAGEGNSGRGRLQVNAAHTWLLDNELTIRPEFDSIDLLSPNAVGLAGASRPRHQLDLTLGYASRGLGVRLNAQHRGTSYLNLTTGDGADVLRFSPLTTLNLRAFIVGTRLGDAPLLKGTRLTLAVANVMNDRQRIRDSAGVTPLSYQRDYRDPLGRTVEIELRKVF